MRFRLKAFALHLLVSAGLLTFVLGTLYLGWYRWPGWYLAGVSGVVAVMAGVDVTIGPLMTFIIARPTKPRSELARDIAIIATMQLCALLYATASLWMGRPLYYAFSVNTLQLVQANDISAHERTVARQLNPGLLPHWYSLPRWIWAPLPADPKESQKIVMSALSGGDDVISMPRYFRSWQQGLPELRQQLKRVDKVAYFSPGQKRGLEVRLRAMGLDTDKSIAMPLTGRGPPLLAVFDPASLRITAILPAPRTVRAASTPQVVKRYLKTLVARLR